MLNEKIGEDGGDVDCYRSNNYSNARPCSSDPIPYL